MILGIENCTGYFPFEFASFGRDNDGSQADDPNNDLPPEDKKPTWPSPSKPKETSGNKPLQNKQEPEKQSSQETITLPTDRFAAIAGKKAERPTKEQCNYISASKLKNKEQEPNKHGTGKPGSNGNPAGKANAAPQQTRAKALPASFKSFEQAIQLLNNNKGITASLRPLTESTSYIPSTKSANKRQWSYLDSKTYCRRNVIIANISFNERHYVLIEFEQRQNENFTVVVSDKQNFEFCLSNIVKLFLLLTA